jgi:hypothetical protein
MSTMADQANKCQRAPCAVEPNNGATRHYQIDLSSADAQGRMNRLQQAPFWRA